MLSAKFLTDDGVRSLPVACRLVPYDQWLVTHVDTSWKVKDVKQYFLSKCNAWGTTTAPQAPRFRPSSPVTFSAPSRRSSLDSGSWGGTTEDDDDDWDTFSEGEKKLPNDGLGSESGFSADTSRNTSGRTLPSSSSNHSFYHSSHRSQANDYDDAQAATIARYVVVSFSNGFMLDDEAILSWYKLRPMELLEVHNAGSIVSLPRKTNSYAEPYFESLVRYPERPTKRLRGTDDQSQGHASEWKSRWAIIRDGILHLCKDAHSVPTQSFPISSLSKLCGPDQLGITSSSPHIVCAKFDRSSESFGTNGDVDGAAIIQRRQKSKTGSWVVLELPDKGSYESVVRVLHRLAPFPMQLSSPRTPLPSPASPSSPTQTNRTPATLAPTASHTLASSSNSAPFYGVQYPEWRLALLAKARMAGRGATSTAVSMAHASCLIGDRTDRELFHHELPRAPSISEGLRRKAAEELLSESDDDEVEITSASPWIDALSEEDEDADESDADVESEIEWDGWLRDLARSDRRGTHPINVSNRHRQNTIRPGTSSAVPPSSPSSSEYDYDMCEGSGTLSRQRTLSYAQGSHFSGHDTARSNALQRTRSHTATIGVYPFTTTTTTEITTYVDCVPDVTYASQIPSQSQKKATSSSNSQPRSQSPISASSNRPSASQPLSAVPSSSSSPSVSAANPPRANRVRSPSNGSLSRTSSGAASMPTLRSSSPESRVGTSSGGSFGSSAGRTGGIGGVKRIVRGVSIRNAFSAERLARGFENALDFVDGR